MPAYREQLLRSWADPALNLVNRRLEMLDRCLYSTYEPTQPPKECFDTRFTNWLRNLDGDDNDDGKKTLFRLAADLFYVGPDEFLELYRLAYNGPIARWLIDQESIDICASDAPTQLQKAVESTWFCPITDSMRINSFYHVNNIPTKSNLRPDWLSLAHLGDPARVADYMRHAGFKRLVLLEDFIGGGGQVGGTLQYVAAQYAGISILVVPLLICPAGLTRLKTIEQSTAIKVEPIVAIPQSTFVSSLASSGPGASDPFAAYRELALRTYSLVEDNATIGDDPPYHPLGFPHTAPTGGLVVMFSNTPDNTLPLIHWESTEWTALFPRHRRV